MALKPINDQVVAVVGASSGIGRDTAKQFAQQGAKVVVSARNQEGLNSLVEEIRSAGGSAVAIAADVADFHQVKAIADKAVDSFGRLDTWVHAAATSVFGTFDQISPEEFRRVIEVNLMGQVYGAQAALPHLKREGRGALIHITSMEARRSLPYQSPYCASKHGTEGFLDAMRLELQHEGWKDISVTNILPGVINTPFYSKTKTKLGVKPTGIPPYYQPELVTAAILHAAEHPTRDYIVSDAGRVLDLIQKVSPSLADQLLLWVAFEGQKTKEVRREDDPNNLYEPVNDNRVEGDFSKLVVPSVSDWLDKHPTITFGTLAAAALGIAAILGGSNGNR